MSHTVGFERSHQHNERHIGRTAAGWLATIALIGGGLHEASKLFPGPTQVASTQTKDFLSGIESGSTANVLEGGTATVQLQGNKDKYMKITNPVLTKTGNVIGRSEVTGGVETYYLDRGDDDGGSQAQEITYTENGKPVTSKQALADSKSLVIETPQKIKGQNEFAYVAAPGQGFSGEPIAVAVPEHAVTITTTEIVPNNRT